MVTKTDRTMEIDSEKLVAIVYLWSRDAKADLQYIRSHLEQLSEAAKELERFEFSDKIREEQCRELVEEWKRKW